MNQFEELVAALERFAADDADMELEVSKPALPDGVWVETLHAPDGYWTEVEWKRHRGFGVSAGYDAGWNEPPHESYGSSEFTADRMISLWNARETTTRNLPIPVAELNGNIT